MFELLKVTKTYRKRQQEVVAFRSPALKIEDGEYVAVVGPSGSGKTTMLSLLGGMLSPEKGKVILAGESLYDLSPAERTKRRRERIGFVFQFHHLLPEFTALENAGMPALIQRRQPEEVKMEAMAILTEVGLGARLHHKPGELSGGEQQRVAVARALLQKPDLVLADEPTGNLDTHTGDALFSLMRELNKARGTTFVIVTHNDKLSSQADRILHMQDGQIV